MMSLLIALIHNRNPDRLEMARKAIREIERLSGGTFNVKSIEICYQPKDSALPKVQAIWKEYLFWRVQRQWSEYCLLDKQPFLLAWPHFLNHIRRQYYSGSILPKKNQIKQSRDMFIAHKHILAWNTYLESDNDYLLVVEDDVIFHDKHKNSLHEFFRTLAKRPDMEAGLYVSLADGIPKDMLKAEKLLLKSESGLDYYKKPITNTSCGYFMNKSLVREFANHYFLNPWMNYLPIDWLKNALFIEMEKVKQPCECIHPTPGFFEHGSKSGMYDDWRSPEL